MELLNNMYYHIMKIVIARFIEDIDWSYSYSNVIIYNKSSFLYNKTLVAFFCPIRKYIWIKEKKKFKNFKKKYKCTNDY